MGERSTIEWTDHTFNPWWGCTKVSPACDKCYAETWARRFGVKWGPGEPRRMASERTWQEPIRWNAKAVRDGVRRRVFCASMADVFDNDGEHLPAAREWLWALIEETPALDWLLLTKRIGNVERMLPARWLTAPRPNVWLGISVCSQVEADRDVPKLLALPARIRFLSCEPLIGPIDLRHAHMASVRLPRVDWVIVGGESGKLARPLHLPWASDIVRDCLEAGVAVFVKQLGAFALNRELVRHKTSDPKGGILEEFPEDLRVRQFPQVLA